MVLAAGLGGTVLGSALQWAQGAIAARRECARELQGWSREDRRLGTEKRQQIYADTIAATRQQLALLRGTATPPYQRSGGTSRTLRPGTTERGSAHRRCSPTGSAWSPRSSSTAPTRCRQRSPSSSSRSTPWRTPASSRSPRQPRRFTRWPVRAVHRADAARPGPVGGRASCSRRGPETTPRSSFTPGWSWT